MGGNKNKSCCFEIYGFDVIIDSKLRPWILEVNVSPSLSSSSALDKQIKTMLLSDSLYLIGFHLLDRKKLEQDRAKQDKERLLGFESRKFNKPDLSNIQTSVPTAKEAREGFASLAKAEPKEP